MSTPPILNGPIPLFTNPPIQPQFYQPSRFVITAIGQGQTTLVTTSINQNYVIGQLVRFIIPPAFGIRQLNEQSGFVLSIPSPNQVEVDIDSSFYDSFVSAISIQNPQIIAIGDGNSGQINSNGINNSSTFVPGSFINISPA